MKNIDVTALGEVLIDFTYRDSAKDGLKSYQENPGGAPANCACAVSRLGGKSSFIGMTGNDVFGRDIKKTLEKNGVDVSGLAVNEREPTTLAIVSLDEKGERSFSFYRNPGADTQLTFDKVNKDLIRNSRIFHIGSLSMTTEPSRQTTLSAIDYARKSGCLISYDPNWRKALWADRDEAVGIIKSIIPSVDIMKLSEEEVTLLFGDVSAEEASMILMEKGVRIVLLTLGAKGVFCRARNNRNSCFSMYCTSKEVDVKDTTGAGDCFTGAFLYAATRKQDILDFNEKELKEYLDFANAAASICVTRSGAIPALPTLEETQDFISKYY